MIQYLLSVCSLASGQSHDATVLAVSHDEQQYATAVTSFTGFPTAISGAPLCGNWVFPHVCATEALADVILETEWKEWIVLTEKHPLGNNRNSAVISSWVFTTSNSFNGNTFVFQFEFGVKQLRFVYRNKHKQHKHKQQLA